MARDFIHSEVAQRMAGVAGNSPVSQANLYAYWETVENLIDESLSLIGAHPRRDGSREDILARLRGITKGNSLYTKFHKLLTAWVLVRSEATLPTAPGNVGQAASHWAQSLPFVQAATAEIARTLQEVRPTSHSTGP